MKPNPPGVAAATRCSSVNWFSAIFVAPFLTIISASAAVPQAGAAGMNPAEKWVVAQIRAGKSQIFPGNSLTKRKRNES
jgi:hypothetical protein